MASNRKVLGINTRKVPQNLECKLQVTNMHFCFSARSLESAFFRRRAQLRHCRNDVAVTSQVFPQFDICIRPGAETPRVEHNGESAGRWPSVTDCGHGSS